MNKMAGLIDFSLRDLRDKFLADLAKTECELREHLVNTMAVAQVRGSGAVSASANVDELAALEKKLQQQDTAHTSELMNLQKDIKKLRKENIELQGKLTNTEAVDKLEADLEAAHRQIRTLTQENLVLTQANIQLTSSADLNDKYAAQDKKLYAELEAKYKALEAKCATLEQSYSEKQKETAPAAAKVEEPKKEVKKVEKRQSAQAPNPEPAQAPNPEPEPEEEEEEQEEEEEEAEEEGEEPVEFEYKGKTYFLSSDNDVYQEQDGEYVQVGTWNGKKILFQQ